MRPRRRPGIRGCRQTDRLGRVGTAPGACWGCFALGCLDLGCFGLGCFGLDFLGVAVFLCLLMLFRPGRAEAAPFAVTALATVLLGALLPGKWNVLLGALAGALVATFTQPGG